MGIQQEVAFLLCQILSMTSGTDLELKYRGKRLHVNHVILISTEEVPFVEHVPSGSGLSGPRQVEIRNFS